MLPSIYTWTHETPSANFIRLKHILRPRTGIRILSKEFKVPTILNAIYARRSKNWEKCSAFFNCARSLAKYYFREALHISWYYYYYYYYYTHVVSFEIKVCEVDRYAVLRRRNDLPYTQLARRIQIWKRRTLDTSIGGVDDSTTSVCSLTYRHFLFHQVSNDEF